MAGSTADMHLRRIWGHANLGVVAMPTSPKGNGRSFHQLGGKVPGRLKSLHRHKLRPEAAGAIQEVLEPSDLLGRILAVLLALHVVKLIQGRLNLPFIPGQLLIQLHQCLHRTSFVQAVLDRQGRCLVGFQERLGHMPRLHQGSIHPDVHLALLEGTHRASCRKRFQLSWLNKSMSEACEESQSQHQRHCFWTALAHSDHGNRSKMPSWCS
mmetsp:Transcript_129191/g.306594  ORF Transcript_129191/g.306594 Transcript_129191/m.306594 type:complete len:211 (-) Transcript_129191:8-640(-)